MARGFQELDRAQVTDFAKSEFFGHLCTLALGVLHRHDHSEGAPVIIEENSALAVGLGKHKTPVDMIVEYMVIPPPRQLRWQFTGQLSLNGPASPLPIKGQLLEVESTVVLT